MLERVMGLSKHENENIIDCDDHLISLFRKKKMHQVYFPDPLPVEKHIEEGTINFFRDDRLVTPIDDEYMSTHGWVVHLPGDMMVDGDGMNSKLFKENIDGIPPYLHKIEEIDDHFLYRINTYLAAKADCNVGLLVTNPVFLDKVDSPTETATELIDISNGPQYIKPKVKIKTQNITNAHHRVTAGFPIAQISPVTL